jgi:hypothetical protein
MKRLLALALLTPAFALASTPFDGNWMLRLDSLKVSGKPDVYDLSNGTFTCTSCAPSWKVNADGTDQALSGHAYADHEVVKVIDKSSVELIDKLNGKIMNDAVITVSADGSKLTVKFTNDYGDKPATGTFTEKRVAAGAAGSHAISGSWLQDAVSDVSDSMRLNVIKGTDNGIQISQNGQMIDAKFDGKRYAWSNDPGKTMSSFKKLSDSEIEELDHRLGKLTDVTTWTISTDGKSLTLVDTDKLHDTKTSMVFDKQP